MRNFWRTLFMVLIYAFLFAPLLVMIFFSFNAGKSTSVFSGFSPRWYIELIQNGKYLSEYLANSIKLAIASSVIATVFGTLAAMGIHRIKSKRAKAAIEAVNNVPMMNPDIVTGVSMMLLFVFVGTMLGTTQKVNFWTLLIAHITFNLPYVILNVMPRLRSADRSLTEAAMDLGCSPSRAFFKVTLPQILPGVFSGLLMAFTLSFDDFVISYYTSGVDYVTLPVYIYSLVKKTVTPDIYALYSIILILILLLLIGYNFMKSDPVEKKPVEKEKSYRVKKIVAIVTSVAVLLPCCLILFSNRSTNDSVDRENLQGTYTTDYAGTTLNVYNWTEYISDGGEGSLDVIAAFERLTGIKVNYNTYESNEVMYSKLVSGSVSYDVIIPSDYMIHRLKDENRLMKLDFGKITNYGLIDEKYKDLYFDPNNEYSVPYNVGLVGLIYNSAEIEKTPDSWSVMWDAAYTNNILNFNNPRDAFAISQLLLGIDLNSEEKSDWEVAANKLKEQKAVLQGYVMDEVFNKMESGNALLAPYYAGDFLTMYGENSDLDLTYPKEGTNIFVDSLCIPETCQNYEAALMFINFMLEPEIAVANAEYICYASPNTAVLESEEYAVAMAEMHPEWKRILYDVMEDDTIKKTFYYDLPDSVRSYYDSLWEEVKAYNAKK